MCETEAERRRVSVGDGVWAGGLRLDHLGVAVKSIAGGEGVL